MTSFVSNPVNVATLPYDGLHRRRFASADPVVNGEVYIAGLSLGGTDAGNYTLANDSAVTIASIHPVVLSPPPLPPQSTNAGTDNIPQNLFPPPASDVFVDPCLIDLPVNPALASSMGRTTSLCLLPIS
jgi:hypothetical protein